LSNEIREILLGFFLLSAQPLAHHSAETVRAALFALLRAVEIDVALASATPMRRFLCAVGFPNSLISTLGSWRAAATPRK
jgi:hypothetical protein